MTTQKRNHKNNLYVKIVFFFLILTIIAILAILHFALAKATIKIYQDIEEKKGTVLVEMQSENSENISPDSILGRFVNTEFEITATTTSSFSQVQEETAGGYVTIYNNYSKNQILIATTRLLTPDDKLFRITKRVEIPPGGQAEVWAEADQPGEDFVTGPTTFTIPGLWEGLWTYIYGETKTGMELSSRPAYTVTQDDMEKLQQQIEQISTEKSLDIFNSNLSGDLKLDNQQIWLSFETLDKTPIGQESEVTSLTQKVTAHGLIFSKDDLLNAAKEKFNKELKSGEILLNIIPSQAHYKIIELDPQDKEAVIEVTISASVNSSENLWKIEKENLIGKNKKEIKEYLKELDIEDAEVKFFPFWVEEAPRLKDHIIIE